MKKTAFPFACMLVACCLLFARNAKGQSALDPADPIVEYNPAAPPTEPAWGQIGKWVRDSSLWWNTTSYKAYVYKGRAFRLQFPKSYNPAAADGKTYPMMVFFHGLGEKGGLYDNEYQLYHGGEVFQQAANTNKFDGYVLFMQSPGAFGSTEFQNTLELINYMSVHNKLDRFRVILNGLSAGGQGTWDMMINHPTAIAAAMPMSWSSILYQQASVVEKIKFTPIWNFQGGKDGNPAPGTSRQTRDVILAAGGNFTYTEYPQLGHDTWYTAWNEPDFFNFVNKASKANPWPLGGRTEYCPGDVINVTLGLTAGFTAYEWRKDGVVIPGANAHTYMATSLGTYDARVQMNGVWSSWSTLPVTLKIKPPTVSPSITVTGLASRVLPSPDGSTSVQLEVPEGYESYNWQNTSGSTTLGTTRFLTVTTPGSYHIKVTERFGCSSDFSSAFTVVDANGPNKPGSATALSATTLSQTSLRLDWTDNPAPAYNETAFEVYGSTQSGGPYKLLGLAAQDARKFILTGLSPNTTYYFKVRAVNNTGAAPLSNEAKGKTLVDNQIPTTPVNLTVSGTTRSSIHISWRPSTDDVGLSRYEIFINGVKTYVTTDTSFVLSSLPSGQTFNITVRAQDVSGNYSAFSNQASAQTILRGLNYKYYTFTGTWNNMPDFNTLTPAAQGVMPNVSLFPATQEDNFAFLWEGYINIPETGTYYLRTNSDDGSKLWLGSLNATGSPYNYTAVATVDNDGLHGSQDRTSVALNLTAGTYPIAIAFYEQGGGQSITVSWRTPSSGTTFAPIPATAYGDAPVGGGTAPAKPTNLSATAVSFKQINLSWTDNSSNETGFEIWRSTSPYNNFSTVGTVNANVTTFSDSSLKHNTRYYYRVRAVGTYGESDFDRIGQGVDYSYYEQSGLMFLPDFNALTPIRTGRVANFGLGLQLRQDEFQIKFSTIINIPVSGIYTFFLYSDDGSKLYIDGFDAAHLVVDNDGAHGATEKSGSRNLSAGQHTIYVTYFEISGGQELGVKMSRPGFPKQAIPDSYLGIQNVNATTLAPVTAPAYPDSLVANGISKTSIQVNWKDRATTETSYELYRSSGNNSDYYLYATLPANATSFADTGLFANAVFYYKVRAVNIGGASIYTNEDSSATQNTPPVIRDLPSRTARYDVATSINVTATDVDGDNVIFSATGLPSFASLVNNGNNGATLALNPAQSHSGVYSGIRIIASDAHGGTDTTEFTLTVNSNYDPQIGAVGAQTVGESETLSILLNASDANGDPITWTVANVPQTYKLVPRSGGATLTVVPGFATAGTYPVEVTATDGQGGISVRNFTLTVTDRNPNRRVYIRFMDNESMGAPWNNITTATTTGLKDDLSNTTTIGLNLQPNNWNVRHDGPATGNNSGVFPDPVLRNYFYFGPFWAPPTVNAVLTGLNPAGRYNLTFYAGTLWDMVKDNGTTTYTVGTQSVSLYVQNNQHNTVTLNNIQPASNGTITITMTKSSDAAAGFLNALVVNALYDDGSLPLAPKALTASNKPGSGVQLTWEDPSYNESGYEIYRATNAAGPFELTGTVTADVTSYLDKTATGNVQHFYKVRAFNSIGHSAYTETVSIVPLNRVPAIAPLKDVKLKNNETLIVNVTASDDNPVTLKASNLPAFVTFTDNGNGTGAFFIQPKPGSVGVYPGVTVTAKDNSDSTGSASFSITITDKDLHSIYVNMSDGGIWGPKPWHNLPNWPGTGQVFNNIADESGNNSGISITLTEGFLGMGKFGMRARNGKEIYPEEVMRVGYYDTSMVGKNMVISGLNDTRKYNFTFFSSRDDGFAAHTKYTINGESVTLKANYNLNKTVAINGVTPVGGQVNINVARVAGANYSMINSLVIQSYDPVATPFIGPVNLMAVDASTNSISLQWQDRADSETGYEIWRSLGGADQFTRVATVGANTINYTDAGLAEGKAYYYMVRALKGSTTPVYSAYSEAAMGYTYGAIVHVNFSKSLVAPSPWNNTATVPQTGFRWPNFKDNNSVLSSIGMVQTGRFAGVYDAGMNTGNNSGIFPDAVLGENYGLFPGQTGSVKITGLHLGMKYDLTFFASSNTYGEMITAYKVNGKTSLFNASVNKDGTVTMYNLEPDVNGEIHIDVEPGTEFSQFGLLGALIIKGSSATDIGITPAPPQVNVDPAVTELVRPAGMENRISAYPNPFGTDFTLSITAKDNDIVDISIFDVRGQLVDRKAGTRVQKGVNNIRIEPKSSLSPGVYVVKLRFVNRKEEQLVKLVKH
jgi:predicted esterase